jgi:hypothetical protein
MRIFKDAIVYSFPNCSLVDIYSFPLEIDLLNMPISLHRHFEVHGGTDGELAWLPLSVHRRSDYRSLHNLCFHLVLVFPRLKYLVENRFNSHQ